MVISCVKVGESVNNSEGNAPTTQFRNNNREKCSVVRNVRVRLRSLVINRKIKNENNILLKFEYQNIYGHTINENVN